jgi:hypothetical protein
MPSRGVVVVRSGEGLAAVDVQGLAGEEGVRQGEQDALRDVLGVPMRRAGLRALV